MQRTLKKKLQIDRQTIRQITNEALSRAAGGKFSPSGLNTTDPCSTESNNAGDPCWAGYGKPCRRFQ
jgi:hypothetical protein